MPKLSPNLDLLRGESAYEVLARANELEAQGRSIVHLEIGQPDFATPEHIVEAGVRALRDGKTKYNPTLGIPEFRKAITEHIGETHGIEVSPHMVAVTPSGKTGLFLIVSAVAGAGDEVIYPNPGFPTYEDVIKLSGAVPRPVRLSETNQFSFDLDALRGLISGRTKLILINSPSNPTGGVMSEEDLRAIYEVIQDKDIWILSDEIYSRLVYDGLVRAPSIYSIPGVADRTFILDGFSKTYSMTGWRLGFFVFPKEFETRIDKLLVNAVGCTATFTQYAGLAALTGPQNDVIKMRDEFQKRRDFVVDALNAIPGIHCAKPRGAFYVFPNITETGKRSDELSRVLLEDAGVALLSGTAFGAYGEGYIRISYATSMENLKVGLERIKKAISVL
ncbi:MAG: pyridoxal phosphate-dependent aminotransferase [Candidatus Liptonbacteria bacterium]|nr:pyridoxal phosphate-dependent aminotransferase [Candidatus Liptonbacteria bacterium]